MLPSTKHLQISVWQVNDCLRRLGVHLMLHSDATDFSLGRGKAGIALFLFLYARRTRNAEVGMFAFDLLKGCLKAGLHSSDQQRPGLLDGLAGTGWLVQYAIDFGLIEADDNQLLAGLDDALVAQLTESVIRSFSVSDALGLTDYLSRRYSRSRHARSAWWHRVKNIHASLRQQLLLSALAPAQHGLLEVCALVYTLSRWKQLPSVTTSLATSKQYLSDRLPTDEDGWAYPLLRLIALKAASSRVSGQPDEQLSITIPQLLLPNQFVHDGLVGGRIGYAYWRQTTGQLLSLPAWEPIGWLAEGRNALTIPLQESIAGIWVEGPNHTLNLGIQAGLAGCGLGLLKLTNHFSPALDLLLWYIALNPRPKP